MGGRTSNGKAVGPAAVGVGRVELEGESALLVQLGDPLRRGLQGRAAFYRVRIEGLRRGEVVVSVSGAKGRLPLLFGRDELDPGYVVSVVGSMLDRFGF